MHYAISAALAALYLSMGSASAATISFDVDKDWTNGAHVYTNGTQSVSVEAFLYTRDDLPTLYGNPSLASWSGSGGLGICSGSLSAEESDGCASDDHFVDGRGTNEVAILDFGSLLVKLTGITFSNVETDDRYDVFAFANGTGLAATASSLLNLLPNDCGICSVSNFFLGQGSLFGIGADSANTEFKIMSVSFDVIPAAVPLPAAGWMMIGGLSGLAALRKRKKTV